MWWVAALTLPGPARQVSARQRQPTGHGRRPQARHGRFAVPGSASDRAGEATRLLDVELLTVKEAAADLRVHPETLRRWIREGSVPCQRVGPHGLIRLKRAEVTAIVGSGDDGIRSPFTATR